MSAAMAHDESYHRFMLTILYMGKDKPGPTISVSMGDEGNLVVDRERTLAAVRRQARNNHSYPKLCWTCGGWSRPIGGEAPTHTDDHAPIWNGEDPA